MGFGNFAPNTKVFTTILIALLLTALGFHHEDEEGNELEEGIPWSDKDWDEYLVFEADSLIECFVDNWEEFVSNEC